MAGKTKAIPEGYHTVTPYLSVKNAAQAIEFYKKAFGAKELMRMPMPGVGGGGGGIPAIPDSTNSECFDLVVIRETPKYQLPRKCGGTARDE